MTNDSGITATSIPSRAPEPAGPPPVESLGDPGGARPVVGAQPRRRGRPAQAELPEEDPAEVEEEAAPVTPAAPAEPDDRADKAEWLEHAAPAGSGAPPGAHRQTDAGSLPGAGALAALALIWLAAMLKSAHAAVSSDLDALMIAGAAYSLPGAVSATLVAGAAMGLLAARLLAGRHGEGSAVRFGAALGAGLLTGATAGGTFVAGPGSGSARMILAGTIAAAGTIGGAAAGVRARRVVGAAVAAALAVFAVGFVLSLFHDPLLSLYGAGDDPASRESALGWYAATTSVSSGLAAGLTAYRYLGGARRAPGLRWPAYLAAGAGPGLLLLVTELIIRTGGAQLLDLIRAISEDDRSGQSWLDGSRIVRALVVLFLGAIIAMVAFGRTLEPAADDAAERSDYDGPVHAGTDPARPGSG
ncbi:MAG TPA: hypothetical protein VES42_12255 [Pilimelia sp.]|nr:hypothetical protein [Pilimelia sp.]